ncbi:MAG: hypothetical protein KME60_08960 [Cyanomargarita calcarea GSE-NOS-MK-12-04C]|jgi:hypothetical protein|uniref:Uncharacterized protein n=1 Tax=Cyanomargarita calcarea GSE-NOS-MK-12-04C TaxID=2839659 RepID=A0A951UU90_9CYAN|nr:hypothetical protein [Cyanomargarita calcarea GSE-NOS-MK-12-04C]
MRKQYNPQEERSQNPVPSEVMLKGDVNQDATGQLPQQIDKHNIPGFDNIIQEGIGWATENQNSMIMTIENTLFSLVDAYNMLYQQLQSIKINLNAKNLEEINQRINRGLKALENLRQTNAMQANDNQRLFKENTRFASENNRLKEENETTKTAYKQLLNERNTLWRRSLTNSQLKQENENLKTINFQLKADIKILEKQLKQITDERNGLLSKAESHFAPLEAENSIADNR